MIAAPVQCDVDGIPKGSHDVSVPPIEGFRDLLTYLTEARGGRVVGRQPGRMAELRLATSVHGRNTMSAAQRRGAAGPMRSTPVNAAFAVAALLAEKHLRAVPLVRQRREPQRVCDKRDGIRSSRPRVQQMVAGLLMRGRPWTAGTSTEGSGSLFERVPR